MLCIWLFCFFIRIVFLYNRGWVNDIDNGVNGHYYLWSESWYRTFSPSYFWVDLHAIVLGVDSNGYIGYPWVNEIGGVRILQQNMFLETKK